MTDALLSGGTRATIVGLIGATGAAALVVGYQAVFDLLATRWDQACGRIAIGIALAAASYLVARHRDDLIDTM